MAATDSDARRMLPDRSTQSIRTGPPGPATVNKMLSALRGVLKQTWRLGLIEADAYRRAADVENLRNSKLLSGRALVSEEIAKLFETCTGDPTPKGARDAALCSTFHKRSQSLFR